MEVESPGKILFSGIVTTWWILLHGYALAQESDPSPTEKLSEIVVEPEQEKPGTPIDPFAIRQIQKVKSSKLKRPQNQSVADLIQHEPGVNTQTYCANCGAKRLTINGLKGEHTTILIDGLPLHSAVSSFYGVDSIPLIGINNVEVMRGTGASLTAPEAIGGVVNILSADPLSGEKRINTSAAIDPSASLSRQNHSLLGSFATESRRYGVLIGVQDAETKPWDNDSNGVAEAPQRTTRSGMLKFRLQPSDNHDINLRLSVSELEVLGGPSKPRKPRSVREIPAQQTDFEESRIDKTYTGDPLKIADWVELRRWEVGLQWDVVTGPSSSLAIKLGGARQEQNSIYQHGFDYNHQDNLGILDVSYQRLLRDTHLITFGVAFKQQVLNSSSSVLFDERGLPSDKFEHESKAIYVQDTILLSEILEIDAAMRVDQLTIDWLDLDKSIDKTIVAPRLQLRHALTDHLTQRFAYGFGYRAPLTYFESQHGNNENGYVINIDDLERAHSLLYSVSVNTPEYYVTPSIHFTQLEGMAYGLESRGQPIRYESSPESYEIWVYDLMAGYQLRPGWMLDISLEAFEYENDYARKLPTAAIERRIQVSSELEWGDYQQVFSGRWIGARDLSRYGSYRNNYHDRRQFPPPEQPGLSQKPQRTPAYAVFDASLEYYGFDPLTVTFGIDNITDYTQTRAGDSPSTWHWHFDHSHFDGLHTWGPNQGRQIYSKLSMVW